MSKTNKDAGPVLNSLLDVRNIHKQQEQEKQGAINHFTLLNQAYELTRNFQSSDMLRTNFMRFLLDGRRDIDAECGYPDWLTPDHYKAMYDREGIAARVVECEPDESWANDPEIFEDEDEETQTQFEQAWKDFEDEQNAFHFLHRIDVLSGIGQFGVLLFGLDDGKPLDQPVDGLDANGEASGQNDYTLLFQRVFDESVVFVSKREANTASPRYGLPIEYSIQFRDHVNWGPNIGTGKSVKVHWTRVLHVADNLLMSETEGTPRQQTVYNRLHDVRKILSSSGEGYWKSAFPGLAFETEPDVNDQSPTIDYDELKEQIDKYQNGLQRYIAVSGLSTKTLPPNVTEPTQFVEAHLKAIAISIGIPYRVLFGSEEAKLASNQDTRAWNKRLERRQKKYLNPRLIRPYVKRLIAYGILPEPQKVIIEWPDLNSPTDMDKATIAASQTTALASYVAGGVQSLIPPKMYLTEILGIASDKAEAMIDGAADFADDSLDAETEKLMGSGLLDSQPNPNLPEPTQTPGQTVMNKQKIRKRGESSRR